jgi:hypothetical protein
MLAKRAFISVFVRPLSQFTNKNLTLISAHELAIFDYDSLRKNEENRVWAIKLYKEMSKKCVKSGKKEIILYGEACSNLYVHHSFLLQNDPYLIDEMYRALDKIEGSHEIVDASFRIFQFLRSFR